jgi:glutathione S-transferase
MAVLKLHYFDFHGGRGEPVRLAMYLGGVEFEDRRIPLGEWPGLRDEMPFHALPVLEVDGRPLSQSNAITRYVGRFAGLYPADPWQAAICDEVMDAVEDIVTRVVATFFIEDEGEKRDARLKLVDDPLPLFLRGIEARLVSSGGTYFADGRLTIADLKVFVWIRQLRAGILDHIPVDLPDRVAPRLVEHFERVDDHPKIKQYYATH